MVKANRNGQKRIKPHYVKEIKPIIVEKRSDFICKFCNNSFSSEKTLIIHLCEQKRRFNQKDTVFARFGLEAYIAIQKKLNKEPQVTEEEFRKSKLYLACVRWGHYVVAVRCSSPEKYLDWLLNLNIPIDNWNKDEIYNCWIQNYIFIENPWDAFEKSFKYITVWANELHKKFFNYFKEAGNARILTDIQRGNISGWIIFCSESGQYWINQLEASDLELIWNWINPGRWTIKLEQYKKEADEIKNICKKSLI